MENLRNIFICMKSFLKDEEFLDYIRSNRFKKYNDFFLNMIIRADSNKESAFQKVSSSIEVRKLKKLSSIYESYYSNGSEFSRKLMIIIVRKILEDLENE